MSSSTQKTRRATSARVAATFEGIDFSSDLPPQRYLLVERNIHSDVPPFYATTHITLEDVRDYSVNQDCASDWEPVLVVVLDTGEPMHCLPNFQGLTFVPKDEGWFGPETAEA